MARKNKPCESPKTLVKTDVFEGRAWQEKTNLTVIGNPSKTLYIDGFSFFVVYVVYQSEG